MIMIMLVSMVYSTSSTNLPTLKKDKYHLIVEGSFLNQKNVNYTVYEMNHEGTFVSIDRVHARKYFSIVLDVNRKYIIRFEDKEHNVKFLLIDATDSGNFEVDVDFSKPHDAILKMTKVGYAVTPLTSGTPPSLAQK